MWLPIVICLLAVAMIVGPVMLMQPTAAQRRQAGMRQKAANMGLRVHLQPLPGTAAEGSKATLFAVYCLPWENPRLARNVWVLSRKRFAHDLHVAGEWDWEVKSTAVDLQRFRACLRQVPEKLMAVSSGPQGLCAFWQETGTDADVESIADWLKRAAAVLSAVKVTVNDVAEH